MKKAIENTKEAKDTDISKLVDEFGEAWGRGEDAVTEAASVFHEAVAAVGWDDAFDAFNKRYGSIGKYNFQMLDQIGCGSCDVRVWFLPKYMHGIRNMDPIEQAQFFGTGSITIYKFASEKPKTIRIGDINQSDWRVAFDRENALLRSTKEQREYIRAKKDEFARRIVWHVNGEKVVFKSACTVTKAQLKKILEAMK